MTEDPREFGLTAADLREAAAALYPPDDYPRPGQPDWGHSTRVRYGRIRSRLRGLADAIEAPPLTHSPAAYTDQAVAAVTTAAQREHDFGGWLSLVLCRAAAQLGSLDALTAGRPGSWEAGLVDALARGLAFDDEGLADYRVPGTT
jgi:hypothetical protein